MTNEELVYNIQNNIDVKNSLETLYCQNHGMIWQILKPFVGKSETDDLLQESYIAMQKAALDYDPKCECKFIGYMAKRVYWHLVRYLKNTGTIKRVPLHILDEIKKYHMVVNQCRIETGVLPNSEYIAKEMGVSERKVKNLETYIFESSVISINAPMSEDGELKLEDIIAGDDKIEEDICDNVALSGVWNEVDKLENRKRRLIYEYHLKSKTLEEIANDEGLSGERIRKLLLDGYEELRKNTYIKSLGECYGYDCQEAYHYTTSRFKRTFTSSVEYLAMRNVSIEEQGKKVNNAYDEIMNMIS